MGSIILNLTYSGQATTGQSEDDQCIKTEVSDVGLSESTCGGGNRDLYNYLTAWINGGTLPTVSKKDSFGAVVWAQDLVGNGYAVTVAKGTLNVENSVTAQPTELIDVSPIMIGDGMIDLEKAKGWVIDKIWSVSWSGSITENRVDPDGTRSVISTAMPQPTSEGGKINLHSAKKVYGALKVKYELTRDRLTVTNDGEGDDSLDPYSTSLSFDVDGCEEETLLQLPSEDCLKEQAKYRLEDLFGWEDLFGGEGDDTSVEDQPPVEKPKDTSDTYAYCTREWKYGDNPEKEGSFISGGNCECPEEEE